MRDLGGPLKSEGFISPIIEPVKNSFTLIKTIESLRDCGHNFNLILNPQVGEFNGIKEVIAAVVSPCLSSYRNYQPALVINGKTRFNEALSMIGQMKTDGFTIICDGLPQREEDFFTLIGKIEVKYVVLSDSITSKRFIREIKKAKLPIATLSDPFRVQRTNADYLAEPDEFFSDEHLFYVEEGYAGFSDFVTIGREFSESGFLPYAVAIHLTYKNKEDEFRIRHFVSDSNEDTTDVPGKFGEALEKLVTFIDRVQLRTAACQEFRRLRRNEDYPGLGSVKKLSIQNHFELVYDYLSTT